jgi:hypothetical protein
MQEKSSTQGRTVEPVLQGGSALREKMVAVMQARELSLSTQVMYVRAVRRMVAECGRRPPDAIPVAEARRYVAGLTVTYRSCGNRHCPACGQADAALWLEAQKRLLLPGVTYHLVTFTVPDALRRPIRSHPREALPILFEASASALLDLCRDPRHLGALPALTAVLHTWTRQLLYHPHVHFLASGGGLAPDGAWRFAQPKFLVPVRALSAIFAALVRDLLREREPDLFAQVPVSAWRRSWVVHSKPVGAGGHALA